MAITLVEQKCDCVLDDAGKLIERVGDCKVDHVPEEDTSEQPLVVEQTLAYAVKRCEEAAKRFPKHSKTGLLFLNCASALTQLGTTVETLSAALDVAKAENDRLKAELEHQQASTKRIVMP